MTFEGHFSLCCSQFPRPIFPKLYTIRPRKLNLLIRNHTTPFRWHDCRWPWRYFKVIRLFHIRFLVRGALFGNSYYRVQIGNHTPALIWCHFNDLEGQWRSFQSRLSLPRPASQKLYEIRLQNFMNLANRVISCPSRSSNVIDFGTNRKRVYIFLLVVSNLDTILHRFKDTAA